MIVRVSGYFSTTLVDEIRKIADQEKRKFAPMLEILASEAVASRKTKKPNPKS